MLRYGYAFTIWLEMKYNGFVILEKNQDVMRSVRVGLSRRPVASLIQFTFWDSAQIINTLYVFVLDTWMYMIIDWMECILSAFFATRL